MSRLPDRSIGQNLGQAGFEPRPQFQPTPQQWEEHRETIIDLYEVQNKKLEDVKIEMNLRYGFNPTKKMYVSHLKEWNVKKYSNDETKDLLCEKFLNDSNNGRDTSYMTLSWTKKLLKHCKAKRPDTDPKLLELLRSLEKSVSSKGEAFPSGNVAPPNQGQTSNSLAVDDIWADWQSRANESAQPNKQTYHDADNDLSETSESSDDEMNDFLTRFVNEAPPESSPKQVKSKPTRSTTSIEKSKVPNPGSSISKQPAKLATTKSDTSNIPMQIRLRGDAGALEDLLRLTSTYYTSRLEEHTQLTKTKGPKNLSLEQSHFQSKTFWTSVKNAIYLIKENDETLPFPMLVAAGNQIPQLCATQPLSLLREMLTTLSIVNTDICEGLRHQMLRLFAQYTHKSNRASTGTSTSPSTNDPLHEICLRLLQGWICDEALTYILNAISGTAQAKLDPKDDEISELCRARIQFLRRRKDLATAESLAINAQRKFEAQFGKESVKTRIVMSQRVYILNKTGRTEQAFDLAEDIVNRARRHDGPSFPSQRAIYEIEDLAESYERLKKPKEAVFWLKIALKGTLKGESDKGGMLHINNKLHKLDKVLGSGN